MKFAIVALCLVVVAESATLAGRGPVDNSQVQVVQSWNNNNGLGDYNFAYELTDGTKRQEQAVLKNPGTPDEALSVAGSYSWVDADGIEYLVTFIADENGFKPEVSQGAGISGPLVASLLG